MTDARQKNLQKNLLVTKENTKAKKIRENIKIII